MDMDNTSVDGLSGEVEDLDNKVTYLYNTLADKASEIDQWKASSNKYESDYDKLIKRYDALMKENDRLIKSNAEMTEALIQAHTYGRTDTGRF